MDQLRIFSAGSGSKMPLLHEARPKACPGVFGSQSEVASDAGSIDSASDHEHIERRFLKVLDLLETRIRHSVTSLEDAVPKNISRIRQPRAGAHARYER